MNSNEDCLSLNVFTPTLNPSAKLPVIVWIHGGANVSGGAPGYDGSKLAQRGDVVVVSIQYRLNTMGWFAHPALDEPGRPFGNYGLLDQQLALKWVQRNVAQFGGDSGRVTLSGQSNGALNTALNMASPSAAGLFHRAICMSYCIAPNLPGVPSPSLAVAEQYGVALAEKLGCGSGADAAAARCLRGVNAADIQKVMAQEPLPFLFSSGIIDGQILPVSPITAFATGKFNHVPLINGNTADESNFFIGLEEYYSSPVNEKRTPPNVRSFEAFVNSTFAQPRYPSGTADSVRAQYPLGKYSTVQEAWNKLETDRGVCGQRMTNKSLATRVPVYAYEFADRTAPFYFPDMPGFESGAYHTADLQYLFPGWHGGPDGVQKTLTATQTRLSDILIDYWARFAATGDPNEPDNISWPRYNSDTSDPAWLIQKLPIAAISDQEYARVRNCAFWDTLAPYTSFYDDTPGSK